MADTNEYFAGLQARVENGDFSSADGFVYQFNIAGAGEWYIDLRDQNEVGAGTHDSADCTISTDKDTFDSMIENPMNAMGAFMNQTLTTDNVGLAMKLQSFLG